MSAATKHDLYQKVLVKYLPEVFVSYVTDLLILHKVKFKIVAPRTTKLGDFRVGSGFQKPQITINGNLNPYAFLITTIHEFAHFKTFEKFGNRVSPHGLEWKSEFKELLEPVLQMGQLPEEINFALQRSLNNLKASSCSDVHLSRQLAKFDLHDESIKMLENLAKGECFLLQGKVFCKGELRRKRFLCTEIKTNKNYLVSAIAKVTPIE
jgi:SprT protein